MFIVTVNVLRLLQVLEMGGNAVLGYHAQFDIEVGWYFRQLSFI